LSNLGKQEGVEIAAINGRSVTLSNGRVIEDVDAVLLGTGYGGPKYHPNLDIHDDTPFWSKVSAKDIPPLLNIYLHPLSCMAQCPGDLTRKGSLSCTPA
jgi:hypothetical protein